MQEQSPVQPPPSKQISQAAAQSGSGNNRFPQTLPQAEQPLDARIRAFRENSEELKSRWHALIEKEHEAERRLYEIEGRLLELAQSGIRGYSNARKKAAELLTLLQEISAWLHSEERKRSFEEFHLLAEPLSKEESGIISSARNHQPLEIDCASMPSILKTSSENILKGLQATELTAASDLDFYTREEHSPSVAAKAADFLQQALNTTLFLGYYKFYGLLVLAIKTLNTTTHLSSDLSLSDARRKFF